MKQSSWHRGRKPLSVVWNYKRYIVCFRKYHRCIGISKRLLLLWTLKTAKLIEFDVAKRDYVSFVCNKHCRFISCFHGELTIMQILKGLYLPFFSECFSTVRTWLLNATLLKNSVATKSRDKISCKGKYEQHALVKMPILQINCSLFFIVLLEMTSKKYRLRRCIRKRN